MLEWLLGNATYIFGVLLVIGLLMSLIDWRKIFERLFGNNPMKARVYVETDEQVEVMNGKMVYSGTKGMMYQYHWQKENCVVCVPFDYPYKYLNGRRMIRVRCGEVSPRAWDGKPLASEGVFSVSALVYSHLVREAVMAMTSKKQTPWLWIMIISGVLLAGYILYTYVLAPQSEAPVSGLLQMLGVV